MQTPSKCPWGLRKILNHKNDTLLHLTYKVGYGSSLLLWHDSWANNVPIIHQLGLEIISIMESSNLAKVCSVQDDEGWNLGPSNHVLAIELRHICEGITMNRVDQILWNGDNISQVKLSSIWQVLRTSGSTLPWTKIIWNHFAIVKFSFTSWLIVKERLLTKDRMIRFGMNVALDCLLCTTGTAETHEHLFCQCPFFKSISSAWPVNLFSSWYDLKNGNLCVSSNIAAVKWQISALFVTASFYAVWAERNNRMHNHGHCKNAGVIVQEIKSIIRDKLFSNAGFAKRLRRDHELTLLLY